jgi:hypothetical protein
MGLKEGRYVCGNCCAIIPASSCALPAGGHILNPTMQMRVLPGGTGREGGGLGLESPPPIAMDVLVGEKRAQACAKERGI